jgi:hypothetical protein
MKRKEGDQVKVTVTATVVLAGKAGYLAHVDQPLVLVRKKK